MDTRFETDMLIGSSFASGTEAPETIFNPRTGATIMDLPEASLGQIEEAVAAAEKAFTTWSRTTPGQLHSASHKRSDSAARSSPSPRAACTRARSAARLSATCG